MYSSKQWKYTFCEDVPHLGKEIQEISLGEGMKSKIFLYYLDAEKK
jgi:hypothetical protein